jgi:hypothetical protein
VEGHLEMPEMPLDRNMGTQNFFLDNYESKLNYSNFLGS